MIKNINKLYLKNMPINNKVVFVDSMLGSKLNGELFFAVRKILETSDFQVVISSKELSKTKKHLLKNSFNLDRIKIVRRNSKKYWDALITAKYLLSDVTFPKEFIKRDDQVYFNTWHGTPLKNLGIKIKGAGIKETFNVIKNFKSADRIILDNKFLEKEIKESYLLEKNIVKIKKYLKNSVLDIPENDLTLKNNNTLILFTWPEINISKKKIINSIINKLSHMDKLILSNPNGKDFSFYIKLHHFFDKPRLKRKIQKKISFIKILPDWIETNTAINIFDNVITDFSSVVFDAAYIDKKVYLDFSDEKTYNKNRGLLSEVVNDLPYKKYETISNLLEELIAGKYDVRNDYLDFKDKYTCRTDHDNSWVDEFINFSDDDIIHDVSGEFANEKLDEWMLFYPGILNNNGITSSAKNYLNILMKQNRKVMIWVPVETFSKAKAIEIFGEESENLKYYLTYRIKPNNFMDRFCLMLTLRNSPLSSLRFIKKRLKSIYESEALRNFSNNKFDKIVHFSGYEFHIGELMKYANANEKVMYVHNDMVMEWKKRRNYIRRSVFDSYDRFDKIICVSEFLRNELIKKSKVFERNKHKFFFINNPLPPENVIRVKAEGALPVNTLQAENYSIQKSKVLSMDYFNIVSVGRFSREKNQLYLLKTFIKLRKKHPELNTSLHIVASLKELSFQYANKVERLIKHSKYSEDIYLYENINVFALLKNMDLFVLPSKHEGFPMVNIEAAAMGLNVIMSNLPGNEEQGSKYNVGQIFDLKKKNALYSEILEAIKQKDNFKSTFSLEEYNQEVEKQIDKVLLNNESGY